MYDRRGDAPKSIPEEDGEDGAATPNYPPPPPLQAAGGAASSKPRYAWPGMAAAPYNQPQPAYSASSSRSGYQDQYRDQYRDQRRYAAPPDKVYPVGGMAAGGQGESST